MRHGSANDLPDIQLDPAALYREDIFTDRRAGSIRRLTPVTPTDAPDPSRAVLYSGQTQLLTPAGVLPLGFEIEAATLPDALEQVPRRRQGGARAGHRGGARIAARGGLAHRGARCRQRPGPGPRRCPAAARSSFPDGRTANGPSALVLVHPRAAGGAAPARSWASWPAAVRRRSRTGRQAPIAPAWSPSTARRHAAGVAGADLSRHRARQRCRDDYFGTSGRRSLSLARESRFTGGRREWVQAQNALSQPRLEALPQREWVKERLTQLWNYERFACR